MCIRCDECFTGEHILLNCSDLIQTRVELQLSQHVVVVFKEVSMEKIFNYLKAINIFGKNLNFQIFWVISVF